MAASHEVAFLVVCLAVYLAPAASELVYSTDALAMARVLVSTGPCTTFDGPSCLELITSGTKAPKFTGHAKSAAIYADSETQWGLHVLLTTGSDVKAVSSINYNVAKETAPTYPDITNTAIGPASHDAVVLDFWVSLGVAIMACGGANGGHSCTVGNIVQILPGSLWHLHDSLFN
jgi:hypothetical protein